MLVFDETSGQSEKSRFLLNILLRAKDCSEDGSDERNEPSADGYGTTPTPTTAVAGRVELLSARRIRFEGLLASHFQQCPESATAAIKSYVNVFHVSIQSSQDE